MINLKIETLEVLEGHGYTVNDIEWVGSDAYEISQDYFWELADREYDNGYGSEEVCTDLIIGMKDGSWFERGNYDGAEWWKHKIPVRRPNMYLAEPKTLFVEDGKYFLGEYNVQS